MQLSVNIFQTLDGVMQAPGGVDEDPSGGFAHGGWLVPFAEDEAMAIVGGWYTSVDAVLLGRTTYEIMAPYWSQVTDPENVVAAVLNDGRKYVVSTTLGSAEWGDTTVLPSLDAVRELKASGEGELQLHGSAGLAAALHTAGLIDEYRLITFPVTVGAGKRLFAPGAPPRGFEVTSSRFTAAGVSYVVLRPAPFAGGGTFTVSGGSEDRAGGYGD